VREAISRLADASIIDCYRDAMASRVGRSLLERRHLDHSEVAWDPRSASSFRGGVGSPVRIAALGRVARSRGGRPLKIPVMK